MATKLRELRLTSVDLVRSGANQEADICLYKSMGSQEPDPPPVRKSDHDRYDYIEEFP